MPLFLSLSLALPAVLFAAYKAKRLFTLEWNEEWNYEKHHPRSTMMEGVLLRSIYWMCLIVALILVIMDLAALFNLILDYSLFLSLTQAFQQRIYTNPGAFVALLCCLALITIIFLRQRKNVLDSSKSLVHYMWYILFELPVRLLLDPAYRGLQTLMADSSYIKATLYLIFYALLYVTLAAACSYLVWGKVSSGLNSRPPAGLVYVLFYLMAFMVNAIGTVFNWFLLHILGILFIVKSEKEEEEIEEELPLKSIRRIYYTVYYR